MRAFQHHFAFEFKTAVRNKNLLLLNYLFPVGFYLMMALIMPGINPTFLETLIPAMVIFAILAATMLGLPDPLVSARESGIYRTYKINGIPAASILLIPALTTLLHLGIVTAFIVITASVFFNAPSPTDWGGFSLTFFAASAACIGLAVLIGVISSTTRMTVLWAQLIFVPSMLLGGMMLPYSLLPPFGQIIAKLLPATYAMNTFNALAMGGTADFDAYISAAILISGGLLAFGLAMFLFQWDRNNKTHNRHPALGLLALIPYVIGIFLL
ncbi:MAG: ABC transporter permease [Anaerolineae bacterium]|nr:ABC transporter permease [Anaerolineae bacterium]